MNIFSEIKSNLYSPEYYQGVSKEKLSASFAYFISLALFVALAVTIIVSLKFMPIVKTTVSNFVPEVTKRFPEDLVITIKGGQVSTNKEEPVAIPLHLGSSTLGVPDNLLFIDTVNVYNEGRFREARTIFYVSKDAIYAGTDRGEVQQFNELNLPDTTIDRAMLVGWLGELSPLLSWVPFILIIAIFIASFSVGALILFELIITALLIMFLSRYRGGSLSYKESYQVGLHLASARLLLDILVVSFPVPFFPIVAVPFFSSLLILVLFWVNFPPSLPAQTNETPVR